MDAHTVLIAKLGAKTQPDAERIGRRACLLARDGDSAAESAVRRRAPKPRHGELRCP